MWLGELPAALRSVAGGSEVAGGFAAAALLRVTATSTSTTTPRKRKTTEAMVQPKPGRSTYFGAESRAT